MAANRTISFVMARSVGSKRCLQGKNDLLYGEHGESIPYSH